LRYGLHEAGDNSVLETYNTVALVLALRALQLELRAASLSLNEEVVIASIPPGSMGP